MPKPDYDTTLARIAGNIAAGIASDCVGPDKHIPVGIVASASVALARAIIAEIKRTEPAAPADDRKDA